MCRIVFIIIGIIYGPDIALSQELNSETWSEILKIITSTLGVDGYVGTYILVMTGLRLLAEGGGIIADKTESKFDNKMIIWLAKSLNAVSWFAGIFGVGTPKNTKKPIKKKED